MVFHVLNRAARRQRLFDNDGDYAAFVNTLDEAQTRFDMPLLAYCVMPNHFHLVARPARDGQLSGFMAWLQMTHSKRWQVFHELVGIGAVYQGRFKAFPLQSDHHFLTVCRYVERNPLRARLVARAQDWRWSSLSQRAKNCNHPALARWPISPPASWTDIVNAEMYAGEVAAIRAAVKRSAPYGSPEWKAVQTANGIGARHAPGRPRHVRSSGDLPFA